MQYCFEICFTNKTEKDVKILFVFQICKLNFMKTWKNFQYFYLWRYVSWMWNNYPPFGVQDSNEKKVPPPNSLSIPVWKLFWAQTFCRVFQSARKFQFWTIPRDPPQILFFTGLWKNNLSQTREPTADFISSEKIICNKPATSPADFIFRFTLKTKNKSQTRESLADLIFHLTWKK